MAAARSPACYRNRVIGEQKCLRRRFVEVTKKVAATFLSFFTPFASSRRASSLCALALIKASLVCSRRPPVVAVAATRILTLSARSRTTSRRVQTALVSGSFCRCTFPLQASPPATIWPRRRKTVRRAAAGATSARVAKQHAARRRARCLFSSIIRVVALPKTI